MMAPCDFSVVMNYSALSITKAIIELFYSLVSINIARLDSHLHSNRHRQSYHYRFPSLTHMSPEYPTHVPCEFIDCTVAFPTVWVCVGRTA